MPRTLLLTTVLLAFVGRSSIGDDETNGKSQGLIVSAHTGEIQRHRVGAWSVLTTRAANHRDQAADGEIAAFFPPHIEQQYGREMWVPPHAYRTTWLPIKIPSNIPAGEPRLQLKTLAIDNSSGQQVLRRHEGDLLTSDMQLFVEHSPGNTATYFRKSLPNDENIVLEPDEDAYDLVLAARKVSDMSPMVTNLSVDFQSPWSEALQGFEQIVLTGDRITHDSAGISAFRGWLLNGGRLWVMLDRVSPDTVRAIIGNSMNFEVVDRVELDQYEIETYDASVAKQLRDSCNYEQPVEMVRVVGSSMDVTCRVNGWPGAFWLPYGEGEVLFTTLAPRGWIASGKPTEALQVLSTRYFSASSGRVDPKGFQYLLQQKIGYKIPSRAVAIAVLGGYCGTLLLAGVVLALRNRLDSLAWIVPGITTVATVVLVFIGRAHSTSVPTTIANGQLLRFASSDGEVRVDGLAAVYDQNSRQLNWSVKERGRLLPEIAGDNEVRRLMWTDDDRMAPQNSTSRAGSVGLAEFASTAYLPQRVAAEAEFGPSGLVGKLYWGDMDDVLDPVVTVTPAPAMAVEKSGNGRWQISPEQVLSPGQYIASNLLTDEQQQRQEYCRALLNPIDSFIFPKQPSLLFWCRPLTGQIDFPDGFEQSGTALAVVPIELRRTPPDTAFQIPSSFIGMEPARVGQGNLSAYNRRTGEWVKGLTTSAEIPLRFQLPSQVLPCQITTATLLVRINAPSREFQISSYSEAGGRLLKSFRNANGALTIELDTSELKLDDRGGITLGFTVSAISSAAIGADEKGNSGRAKVTTVPQKVAPWQIDYVRLTVGGRTLPLSE